MQHFCSWLNILSEEFEIVFQKTEEIHISKMFSKLGVELVEAIEGLNNPCLFESLRLSPWSPWCCLVKSVTHTAQFITVWY